MYNLDLVRSKMPMSARGIRVFGGALKNPLVKFFSVVPRDRHQQIIFEYFVFEKMIASPGQSPESPDIESESPKVRKSKSSEI